MYIIMFNTAVTCYLVVFGISIFSVQGAKVRRKYHDTMITKNMYMHIRIKTAHALPSILPFAYWNGRPQNAKFF